LLQEKQKRGDEPRFVRGGKDEKSRRAAASYSEVLLVVVRGVITMMPFSPLFSSEAAIVVHQR
jgi:hypothetical protein